MNKKAISPIIGTVLLIVVSIVAVMGYQQWYYGYQSKLTLDTEIKSTSSGSINVEYISNDGTIYVNNNGVSNITMKSIKVSGIDCNINKEVEPGVTPLDISSCMNKTGTNEILIISDSGIIEKKVFIKNEVSVPSLPLVPSLSFSVNQSMLNYNSDIQLTWTSSNLDNCVAQDDWSGTLDLANFTVLSNIKSNKTYTINCTGVNGNLSRSLNVNITSYPSCVNISSGLVGLWHFDNSVVDSSLNTNNGVLGGNANFNTNRQTGSHSLYLDGSGDYMNVVRHVSLEPSKLTFAGWYNVVSIPDGLSSSLMDKIGYGSPWPGYMTWVIKSGSNFYLQSQLRISSANRYASGPVFNFNGWHHFLLTYDQSRQVLYVDGNIVSNTSIVGSIDYNTNTALSFGKRSGSSGKYYNGYIDESFVANRILTSSEIYDVYNLGKLGIPICNP